MKVQCYECGYMCHCDLDPESVPDSWTCEECLDDFFFRDSLAEDDLVESACAMANPNYPSTSY